MDAGPDDPIAHLQKTLDRHDGADDRPGDPVGRWFSMVSKGEIDLGPWSLGDLREPDRDPWRTMIVGRKPDPALLAWRFDAAGLLPTGRGPAGAWLVVDAGTDGAGRHRAYRADSKGKTLTPAFEDIGDMARWALDGITRGAALEPLPRLRPDAWSRHPNSADQLWAPLGTLHPAGMYQAWRAMVPPVSAPAPAPVDPTAPGGARASVHWTLARFAHAREVTAPPGTERSALATVHRVLLDRLEELHGAMTRAEVPPLVADLALDDDDALAAAAMDWMLLFDQARAPGGPAPEEPPATSAVLKSLRQAIEQLRRREVLDIQKTKVKALADDLLEAALGAPTPRTVPRTLVEVLLESPHVDEIYADDGELLEAFRVALGL